MHKKTIVLVLSLFLVSCASVPMDSPQKDQQLKVFNAPQGKAGIYIYRPYAYVGSAGSSEVLIDGDKVGELVTNTYLYIEVSTGRHVVTAQYGGSIPLDVVSGKLFFVSATVGFAGTNVKLENDADGKAGVMNCALVQTRIPADVSGRPLAGMMSSQLTGGSPRSLGYAEITGNKPAPPTPPQATPPVPATISVQPPVSAPLPADEEAHFRETLAHGKPAQLYFLAMEMTHGGHEDLAIKLYQKLVDKYPDDIYTAKAIEKMDRGLQPRGGAMGSIGTGSGSTSQQVAHIKEAHDACVALCDSQARQCNTDILRAAGSSAASAMNSIISGDVFGMLSNMGGTAVAGARDCDSPLRACLVTCPIDPSAPQGSQSRVSENGANRK